MKHFVWTWTNRSARRRKYFTAKNFQHLRCDLLVHSRTISKRVGKKYSTIWLFKSIYTFESLEKLIRKIRNSFENINFSFYFYFISRDDNNIAFAQYHNKNVWACRLANKQNLMSNSGDNKSDRVTLWLEIDVDDWAKSEKMMYRPGDHVGMLAANREELVSGIIPYLQYDQDPDEPMELQMLKEKHTSTGAEKH